MLFTISDVVCFFCLIFYSEYLHRISVTCQNDVICDVLSASNDALDLAQTMCIHCPIWMLCFISIVAVVKKLFSGCADPTMI